MADVKTLTIHGTTYDIKDSKARTDISSINDTVSELTSTVKANKSDTDTSISNLTERVSTSEADITEIKSDISDINDDIAHTNSLMYAPNILVNGDFNVYQRGTGPFTITGGGASYTVDMWYLYHGNNASVTKTDNGVLVNNISGTSTCYFIQKIVLASGEYSFRLNVTNIVGDVQLYFRNQNSNTYHINKTGEHSAVLTAQNSDSVLFELPAGSSIELKYVSMTKGTFPYAHIPEDAGTAYQRCARYFYRYKSKTPANPIGEGYTRHSSSGNEARFTFFFPIEMETTPTITLTGELNYETNNLFYGTITEISQMQVSNHIATVTGKTTGLNENTNFSVYISDTNTSSYLDVSCEPATN